MSTAAFPDAKPWPAAKPAPVAIGSNSGAVPPEERVIADFLEGLATDGITARIEQLVTRSQNVTGCDSEDMAGRIGDFVRMAAAASKAVDNEREKHNRPLLTAQRALKAKADGIVAPLTDATNRLRVMLDRFMAEQRRIAEEQRRRAEAQARAAAEAAAKEAAAAIERAGGGLTCQEASPASGSHYIACGKPAAHSVFAERDGRAYNMCSSCADHSVANRGMIVQGDATAANPPIQPDPLVEIAPAAVAEPVVRGDYGSRVGTSKVWQHELQSVRQLPDRILKHARVVEAIEKVIAAEVRGGAREIKGVRIFETEKTVVR